MKVQQVPADDLLVRDGEAAILMKGKVIRLSELSGVIYALAEEPVEVGQLARELEARFGAPEGATPLEATEGAVAELIRHGVLHTGP